MRKDLLLVLNLIFHPSLQRQVGAPFWFSFGYNDGVCPHTSIFSTYNVIKSPKEVFLVLEEAHMVYPEQREQISGQLNK